MALLANIGLMRGVSGGFAREHRIADAQDALGSLGMDAHSEDHRSLRERAGRQRGKLIDVRWKKAVILARRAGQNRDDPTVQSRFGVSVIDHKESRAPPQFHQRRMVDESRVCALDSARVVDVDLTKDPRSFAGGKQILHISAVEPCANRCVAHVGSGGWRLKKPSLHAHKQHGLPLPSDVRGLAVVVDLLNGRLFDVHRCLVRDISSERETKTRK